MFVTFKFVSGDFGDDQGSLGFEVHGTNHLTEAGKVSDESVHGSVIHFKPSNVSPEETSPLTLHCIINKTQMFLAFLLFCRKIRNFKEKLAQPPAI